MVDRVTPPPTPPPGPPCYLYAETCAECFEPFGLGMLDRFFHRRRWGHNPTPLHPRPTAAEQHQENVEAARRYREVHAGSVWVNPGLARFNPPQRSTKG